MRYVVWIANFVNHRIFERILRYMVFRIACLFENHTILSPSVWGLYCLCLLGGFGLSHCKVRSLKCTSSSCLVHYVKKPFETALLICGLGFILLPIKVFASGVPTMHRDTTKQRDCSLWPHPGVFDLVSLLLDNFGLKSGKSTRWT